MVMDDERQRAWCAHCLRMAEATHALADWSEDPAMIAGYIALAAKWITLSAKPPAWPVWEGPDRPFRDD
jgi:hypothetical protein